MSLNLYSVYFMRFILQNILLVISLTIADVAKADGKKQVPESIVIDELKWISPAPIAGLQFSWVHGNESNTGLYVLRVNLAKATRIPPHSHPDQRISTVLSGTLYVGFGEVFDVNNMIAIESGNAYIATANNPHYIWAKDGEVEYQETGIGPTATQLIKNN